MDHHKLKNVRKLAPDVALSEQGVQGGNRRLVDYANPNSQCDRTTKQRINDFRPYVIVLSIYIFLNITSVIINAYLLDIDLLLPREILRPSWVDILVIPGDTWLSTFFFRIYYFQFVEPINAGIWFYLKCLIPSGFEVGAFSLLASGRVRSLGNIVQAAGISVIAIFGTLVVVATLNWNLPSLEELLGAVFDALVYLLAIFFVLRFLLRCKKLN